MFITDAQIHIWGAETPERPWPEIHGTPHQPHPVSAADVIVELDAAGVDRAVLVPPSWEGDRNDLVLRAVEEFPNRFGIMGRVNLETPDVAALESWLSTPGMLGIRASHRRLLADDLGEWFWPVAERCGIPLMILVPGKTKEIGEVAARFPDLRLIIDHLNLVGKVPPDELPVRIDELLELADRPNVAVKISALPTRVGEAYPFPTIHAQIRRIVAAFGAERCMWGSDLTHLPCPYIDWVRGITEAADYLSENEKALIMGGSLSTWLNWPQPE